MTWIGKPATLNNSRQVSSTLTQEVSRLLERLNPVRESTERRGRRRVPIPYLFHLTPILRERDLQDEDPHELSMVVVGKDISDRGISFFHEPPIPFRRGVLSAEIPNHGPIQFEVDLLWCRFTSLGWYESGGRLMGVTGCDLLQPTTHQGMTNGAFLPTDDDLLDQ